MNDEDHVLLSEKLEDQLKAVEWAREQKKKITDEKKQTYRRCTHGKDDTFDNEE